MKSFFLLSIILFRILLDISYATTISKVFAYTGFLYNYSIYNYVISWFLYILMFFIVSTRLRKVSDYFFITALLSIVAPLTSLMGLDYNRSIEPVVVTLFVFYFIYFIVNVKFISFKKMPYVKGGEKVAATIAFLFVFFLIVWYLKTGVTFNLDLSKVYDFRHENSAKASFGLLSYTNGWTYQVFNIYLIGITLYYKRYSLVVFFVMVQVYFFAASAHKSVLFFPVLIFGIWYYFKKTDKLVIVPVMFSLLIFSSIITYIFMDDIWLSLFFTRRVFYVPASLTYAYFDFFADNQYVYWSNSVLSSLISYPYDLSLTHVIGEFLGRPNMGANNGFIASGFAHAGYMGVFIYSLVLGLILRFLNDITYNSMPLWIAIALTVVPLRSALISSDLFTVLLTHGFLVAILLIYLTRKKTTTLKGSNVNLK